MQGRAFRLIAASLIAAGCTATPAAHPTGEGPGSAPGPRRAASGDAPPGAARERQAGEEPHRASFAAKPRHLYGCGIQWAEWRWPGDRSKWPYDARSMDALVEMGATCTWINIPWHDVEPKPGTWDFDYVDHQVKLAEERGLAMFAYTGLTPDWALPAEAPRGQPGIGYRFPPPDELEPRFVTYCRTVAERYKGRIRHYWFWNEPNGCGWVNDGCANGHEQALYTRWLRTWYTAMKQADPDAVLGGGALDYSMHVTQGYKYVEGMYAHGAKDHFDAFAIHPYDSHGTLYHEAIERTRQVMVEHGDGHKGIWVGEYGWALRDEEEKARRLTKTLQELNDPKYYYVTMALYLCLTDLGSDAPFGLVDRDTFAPRASFLAFQRLARNARAE